MLGQLPRRKPLLKKMAQNCRMKLSDTVHEKRPDEYWQDIVQCSDGGLMESVVLGLHSKRTSMQPQEYFKIEGRRSALIHQSATEENHL